MSYLDKARDVLNLEIQGLQKARDDLGKSFDDAITLILKALAAGGKIIVCGVGKNLHIGEKISATLTSTGATSVPLNPTQALHGDLGLVSRSDVVLMLSYSGESEEVLSVLPPLKRLGATIIALTRSLESTLAKESNVVIVVAVDKEACPFNMAPTASTTATLAVGDAIAMTLLNARGFKKEDYAKLHPGGAIGRSLLLRVSDIMRTGDRVPTVQEHNKVKDALLAMTKARSGSAAVVDKDGHVIGIFTDGDLRRNIAAKKNLLEMLVADVMTRSPITVSADELAVDVLMIYEKHKVDDLIVVDQKNRLVGAVDIQDLPGFKVL
ncbi:MAG: KpsF/GutQ family sugar-phosphate isomerase [Lentisphaerae bacterium]|nr:KpsF/GutQ family sugar-phosphate isomerase [Lentisphaerota bacterium]